jgi:tetratricopeptide (TPR) repeat protein
VDIVCELNINNGKYRNGKVSPGTDNSLFFIFDEISFMLKKTVLLLFIVFIGLTARAQSADSVYNRYLDFNLARFQGQQDKVLELGEQLIPDADKLPEKARISFYFAIGKMYEDNDQPEKAKPYYEKVALAVPDYYVVHRALGYLYAKEAGAPGNPDYISKIKKALPHLEKAQACDPSDETLALIKTLYKNINDEAGLDSLNPRLKELSKNCIDVLSDR